MFDPEGKNIGPLADLVFVDGEKFADITHLICCGEDRYKKKINFSLVGKVGVKKENGGKKLEITLTAIEEQITPLTLKKTDLLVSDIIDKQVVDVNGAKVVRINDVVLGKVEDKFSIVAVAVGNVSLFRRLGLGFLTRLFPMFIHEHIIPWESVESLEPNLHDLHLKVQKAKIADMHPEDIADVMEDLSHKERELIFKNLDKKKAVRTLIGAEPRIQESVLGKMKTESIKDLLSDIPVDQAAEIIGMMTKQKAGELLSVMRPDVASKIQSILKYPVESAAAIMKTFFIAVPEDKTAQDTIDMLRKMAPSSETMYHVYVVDDKNHLVGVLSIRQLLISPPGQKVSEIMKKDVIHVHLSTLKREIAKLIAKYDLFVLPVVNKDNVICGVVTADDVLTEVMPEDWRRQRVVPHKLKKQK